LPTDQSAFAGCFTDPEHQGMGMQPGMGGMQGGMGMVSEMFCVRF
jgi:hypothetical protein